MEEFSQADLASVRRWIICIAVVKFDIDEGQMVEYILPKGTLSKAEEKGLAMLSFPDSNSFDGQEGTLKYIFRLKRDNGKYSFGFTCFKQKKDGKQFRGYFQKSLVVLSDLPLLEFYEKLAQFLVFKAFPNNQCAIDQLQTVIKQITTWPDPIPYVTHDLHVLGYKFQADIPGYLKQHVAPNSLQNLAQQHNLSKILKIETIQKVGFFQDSCLFEPYIKMVEILWSLWELVLLNKPFLVLADKPYNACHAVLGAISLISPLEYASHYKPYLTVYDPDFPNIQKEVESKTLKSMVVGATNPLFLKVLKSFPCFINLSESLKKNTKHLETYAKPDKGFSKILMDNTNEQKIAINEALMRKYFRRLTEMFIQKFQEYFQRQTNNLKKFEKSQFIKFVKKQDLGSQCFESKSDLIKLYDEFCESPNFKKYLESKNVIRIQQP